MGKITHHNYPNPTQMRLQHIVILIGVILVLISLPLLVLIAFALNGPLLLMGVPLLGFFLMPLLHNLSATPAVSVDDEGLRVRPAFSPEQQVPWDAIAEARDYPLLPTENHEVVRKFFVDGRKNYRAPRGIMLIIPGLGWRYRATGFFAGANGRPVIAFTSRAHTDYDILVRRLERALPASIWTHPEDKQPIL
ncbi:MAG: PH domain-containing protein [Anaerolineaceae bacterium]|nr:PH domain-containing protein [Anaerolineaceae bacterium]